MIPITRQHIITALIVMALGITILNQSIGYYYKVQLLKEPCYACLEVNPQLESCFHSKATAEDSGLLNFNFSEYIIVTHKGSEPEADLASQTK